MSRLFFMHSTYQVLPSQTQNSRNYTVGKKFLSLPYRSS